MKILKKINETFNKEFKNGAVNNRQELIDYCNKYWCKDVSINTCRGYLQYINMYLADKKIDYKLTTSDFNTRDTRQGMMSEKEVMSYIDMLENEQDKFIIYSLFKGISGKEVEELRTLKVSQVDFENKKIILSDREIEMDDMMIKLIDDAIKQDKYNLIKFSEGAMVQSFKFNMDSEYIIKNRPTKTNGMGLESIKYDSFRKRLKTISQYIDNNITVDTLLKSGYAYMIYKEYGKNATYSKVEKMIKEKNMKVSVRVLLNAYKNIYVEQI